MDYQNIYKSIAGSPHTVIKEEKVDAKNKEMASYNHESNEAELQVSIKQEDYEITIKEEWDAINNEDSLIGYSVALEQLDCINQGVKMLKYELPDVSADDSGIWSDTPQEKDREKGELKAELLFNMCRVTEHYSNSVLVESNNNEFLEQTSYNTAVDKLRCKICTKPFKSVGHLNRHEKIHLQWGDDSLKKYQCHHCGSQFTRNDTLTRHIHNLHEIPIMQAQIHPCPLCGKSFRSACHLTRHSAVHGKQARHFCDLCASSFSQLGDLRRHRTFAHFANPASKVHKCSICGKAYAKRNVLLRHKVSHTRERLFICDICGREFVRKDCLLSHMKNKHIT